MSITPYLPPNPPAILAYRTPCKYRTYASTLPTTSPGHSLALDDYTTVVDGDRVLFCRLNTVQSNVYVYSEATGAFIAEGTAANWDAVVVNEPEIIIYVCSTVPCPSPPSPILSWFPLPEPVQATILDDGQVFVFPTSTACFQPTLQNTNPAAWLPGEHGSDRVRIAPTVSSSVDWDKRITITPQAGGVLNYGPLILTLDMQSIITVIIGKGDSGPKEHSTFVCTIDILRGSVHANAVSFYAPTSHIGYTTSVVGEHAFDISDVAIGGIASFHIALSYELSVDIYRTLTFARV